MPILLRIPFQFDVLYSWTFDSLNLRLAIASNFYIVCKLSMGFSWLLLREVPHAQAAEIVHVTFAALFCNRIATFELDPHAPQQKVENRFGPRASLRFRAFWSSSSVSWSLSEHLQSLPGPPSTSKFIHLIHDLYISPSAVFL